MDAEYRIAATSTITTQQKYVSVFRIDGEPIIPPLMTSEKIRQMQKFKEKAMKIEQRLKERKLRLNKENDDTTKEGLCETSRSSIATGGLSNRSQDLYDAKLKESEESMMILEDIIRRQSGECDDFKNMSSSFTSRKSFSPRQLSNEEKLKKLQKSETLIYDNSTNEVIKQTQGGEKPEDPRKQLRDLEREANLNYIQPKKPNYLLLSSLNDPRIPSICINPPTPLVGNRQFCENDLQDSDDSLNSMFTNSEKKQPPPVPERTYINKLPRSGKIQDLKLYTNVANVTAKVQQFEAAISSDQSSPEKCVDIAFKMGRSTNTMNRSATSPSIKLGMGDTNTQNNSDKCHISPDNCLIRSSSFTLEAPSKVLIDHMRQQRSSSERTSTSTGAKAAPTKLSIKEPTKKSPPCISRVHRDTVESKAKRVQKVDLKPSRQKIQQKVTHHKMAQAAAASISPYKSSASSFTSTSNLYKTKKSPYDTPNSTKISPPQSTPKGSVRKSPTSSVASIQSQRSTKSKPVKTASAKSPTSEKDALTQMDKVQKEKFLRLLEQQEQEQRKLKEAFEMQQKLLIEQLNKEMASTHIRSSPPSGTPPSRASSTQHSENSNGPSLRGSPESPLQSSTKRDYSRKNSSILNENTSLPSNNYGQTTNNYGQTKVPSLDLSNLSSMDHSNANTSMESASTHHVCDQSTYRTDATITPKENSYQHSASANSASRRQLFPQEHTGQSTTFAESSIRPISYSNDNQLPSDPYKGNAVMATTSNSNTRREIDQMNRANAAATIINAYARGFLVRRLFKTEQIQRIVQTIHDSLIFVLNLHIETCENPKEANTPANIKLKARLLQQLSSATRTLHLVLFQTTVKERMDIIARDRKRIKHKLMTMNRNRQIFD
ncbi:uncharacterized protein LOC142229078 isoform X3 [Haematobia irritans]|uniref:uncharacterized protein LOC142229078 isoform X3 n=1 Tax=Haematobia irritans TaxID=7368 RepID=UPI003F4FFC04